MIGIKITTGLVYYFERDGKRVGNGCGDGSWREVGREEGVIHKLREIVMGSGKRKIGESSKCSYHHNCHHFNGSRCRN
jgi:hypothetical protein